MTTSSKKTEAWGFELRKEMSGNFFALSQRVTPTPPANITTQPAEVAPSPTPATTPDVTAAPAATQSPDRFDASQNPQNPTTTPLSVATQSFIEATPRALAHPPQGPTLILPIINTWLRRLSQGSFSTRAADTQALAAAARLPQTGQISYNNYLLFPPRVAQYVQSLETYQRNPSIPNQRAVVDTFLRIPFNLESHRGHPLILLAQYLERRSQGIQDARMSRIVHLQALFLHCADASLSNAHNLSSSGPLARRDEATLRNRIAALRDALRNTSSDGGVSDPLIRSLMEGLAHSFRHNQLAQGNLAAPLALLSLGTNVTGDFLGRGPVTLRDNDGTVHSFLVNSGETPTTFQPVTNVSSTPLNGHNLSQACFQAALCQAGDTSCGNPGWQPAQVIAEQYRPVQLEQGERARPGDVVVYFAPSSWTPDTYGSHTPPPLYLPIRSDMGEASFGIELEPIHMSLVTETDANGRPTRAIGKMGIGRPIMTHDVNHAYGIYGPLIGIYRRREDLSN